MSKDIFEPTVEIQDTALQPDDDDPMMTEDGYTAITPGFDEAAMLQDLEHPPTGDEYAQLPPQEAYDLMKFQAPLDQGELEILRRTPFLDGLSWVDDADHNEWMMDQAKLKKGAMDKILEDQMYGDLLDGDDELGLSLSSLNPVRLVKRAAGGVKSAAKMTYRGARRAASAVASTVKRFVPGRDAAKAQLVKGAYARMVKGHVNFLRKQDMSRGVKRPPAAYVQASKGWARGKLQAAGLPTSLSAGSQVASDILGDDVMGSWWNPFSWFQSKVKYVIQNAAGEMVEMDEGQFNALQAAQAVAQQQQQQPMDPSMMDPNAQAMDPSMMDPGMAPMDPNAMDPNAMYQDPGTMTDYQQGEIMSDNSGNEYDLVVGADDFAGFAQEVLGDAAERKVISPSDYRTLTVLTAKKATGLANPTQKALVDAHQKLKTELPARKISVVKPADVTGAWLYKLDPRYWTKSPRERALIDAEKRNWEKTQTIAKRGKEQHSELEAGRRALYQAEQAKKAEQESAAAETELADIEQSISGLTASGSVTVLGEDPAPLAVAAHNGRVVANKTRRQAGALAAKLDAGQKLSADETDKLRNCVKMSRHLSKLQGALHNKLEPGKPVTSSGYHDTTGEYAAEILGTDVLGSVVPGKATLNQKIAMTAIAVGSPKQLPAFLAQRGIRLSSNDLVKLRKSVAVTKAIMKHPAYGQVRMRGDDSIGSFTSVFKKIVTAPLAAGALGASALAWGATKVVQAPAKLLHYSTRWGGWGSPGSSLMSPGGQAVAAPQIPGAPNPAALNASIAAARQRMLAAQQRITAADSRSAATQQQAQAEADAADAEAQALQAEQEAQQSQYDAAVAPYGATDTAGEGDSVLGADFFTGSFVGEIADPKAKAIVVEASKNTAAGKKIRAGATLYTKAKRGDRKSRLAIAKMQEKAKAGDSQAKHDVNAVRAGKIAVGAKGRAKVRIALKAKKEAANKKGIALRKRLEAGAGNRLTEVSRKRQLSKIAKIERSAAFGDKKAQAAIAKCVANAAGGNKKAQASVAALRLAKTVRTATKAPGEARRLRAAGSVVVKARRGNKKAIRTIALINAGAKQGQPNAKRAKARLALAAKMDHAVATGRVVAPHANASKEQAKKRYEFLKGRVTSGIATREEALGAAKAASSLGLKAEAAQLALVARRLRSGTQPIKDAAATVAAAEKGNAQARARIQDAKAAAEAGDPRGIAAMGKVAAVSAIAAVDQGRPMPKELAEATGIVERAHAGDPQAKAIVDRAGKAAQDPAHPDHTKAVEAAVALTAASAVLAATASKKGANEHWKDKAREARGQKVDTEEQAKVEAELAESLARLRSGTGSYRDGVRAREIAMALNRPQLAAQISAIMPPYDSASDPLSSMPDEPLPEINGIGSLLRESVRAILLATTNPLQNYREGIQSRGATPMLAPISTPNKKG